ncbi:MAG: exonuclease SbcCD subunit D [Anaerolineae bacterium]
MIRLLHFADFHLGMENYGRTDPNYGMSTRIRDFLKRMDEMVEYAKDHSADLVVFAGDAFKNRAPNPTLQREFAHRVRDLTAHCPVVMLVGNHDLAATESRAHSLEIYDALGVPGVLIGSNYDLYEISTRSGTALVGTAPYPIKSRLVSDEAAHGKSLEETDHLLAEAMHRVLETLSERAATSEPSDAPRVLVGHFSVTGANFGSERDVMIGRDVVVPLSALDDPAWDYVALGHIHKHQNLTAGRRGSTPVVYSGSLERVDFGEENEDKGFCWVEVSRGQANWQFVPVNSRPFITLSIDVREVGDPMQKIHAALHRAEVADAIVRVYLKAEPEQEAYIETRDIYGILHSKGAHVVAAVKKEVNRLERTRLGDQPESLTPTQLLERYFQARGVSSDRIKALLERAKPILGEML